MPTIGPFELWVILLMILLMVVLPVSLVAIVIRALRDGRGHQAPARDPAMDALRTRLANGEIDQSEYDRLRSVLQRS